jgi:hypothetical protein
VLRLLLVVVATWAVWTSVSLLGHAIDTCLGSGRQAAAAAPTTGTSGCMAGDVTLWPTGIAFADAPFDLLLVRLPWIVVILLLWLIDRDRAVSAGAAPPRTVDVFSAGGWIGPAAIGSLAMFIIGTALLVPRLL